MHIENLAETFKNFRRYNIKLNPNKCVFGVGEGKFLGAHISRKGITANPKKIEVIAILRTLKG